MRSGYRRSPEADELARISSQDPEFTTAERRLLFFINQKVAAITKLDGVMEFLFREFDELFHHRSLNLFILEEERRTANLQWTRRATGEESELRPGFRVDLPDMILSGPMSEGEPWVLGNLDSQPPDDLDSPWFQEMINCGLKSCLVAPLIVGDRKIGVLVLSSDVNYRFGYHEKRLILALHERISQAIDTGFMVDQLTAANSSYLEMLGFVSHELKNPLAAMVMDGKLLLQGYVGDLTEPQATRIGKIVGKAQYLLSLIREYLDLSRLESGELHARPRHQVDLIRNILNPALEMVSSQIEERAVRFIKQVPEATTMISCDPDLLVIVMVNLLDNATKYGIPEGEVRLDVELKNDGLHVAVRNEGPGFPESEKSRLFRKFSRLRTEELLKRKGTGVGLYTVWQIIRLHGGVVWADSVEGEWAEFGFFIPQPLRIPA